MNERIRELKQQAGIDYNPDQEGLDLFADLIVQDACQILLKWKKEPFPFDENTAIYILKQHFGIKE
jgi:hypothetical protein